MLSCLLPDIFPCFSNGGILRSPYLPASKGLTIENAQHSRPDRSLKTSATMNAVQNVMDKVQDDMVDRLSVGKVSTQPKRATVDEAVDSGEQTDPSNPTTTEIVRFSSKKVACIDDVPRPRLMRSSDANIRVMYCSICSGSDSQYLYSGEIPTMDEGFTLGHDACGVVDEVDDNVKTLDVVGDRVVW
jgi:hypothetical protein